MIRYKTVDNVRAGLPLMHPRQIMLMGGLGRVLVANTHENAHMLDLEQEAVTRTLEFPGWEVPADVDPAFVDKVVALGRSRPGAPDISSVAHWLHVLFFAPSGHVFDQRGEYIEKAEHDLAGVQHMAAERYLYGIHDGNLVTVDPLHDNNYARRNIIGDMEAEGTPLVYVSGLFCHDDHIVAIAHLQVEGKQEFSHDYVDRVLVHDDAGHEVNRYDLPRVDGAAAAHDGKLYVARDRREGGIGVYDLLSGEHIGEVPTKYQSSTDIHDSFMEQFRKAVDEGSIPEYAIEVMQEWQRTPYPRMFPTAMAADYNWLVLAVNGAYVEQSVIEDIGMYHWDNYSYARTQFEIFKLSLPSGSP